MQIRSVGGSFVTLHMAVAVNPPRLAGPLVVITLTGAQTLAIAQRCGFSRLMDKLESGDVLIVTKLDRLGRDAIDVSSTVEALADIGVRVYCLALGGADLTSSAGPRRLAIDKDWKYTTIWRR